MVGVTFVLTSIWWLGLIDFLYLFSHSGAVNSIWWLVVFFDFSPILDWGHFSQVILPIVLQIMPPPKNNQPSGAVNSIWWLGLFFFWPVLPFWTEGIFHKWFCQLYYWLCPTIRCCPQHLMVGGYFFYLFSHSGLRAFFTNDFANCTTVYAPAQK